MKKRNETGKPAPTTEPAPILVVDDRPENILQVERTLCDMNLQIVPADSGRAALKAVLERDFALILLDVMMPGMDGFETAALIRGRERSRETPIIFVTAVSTTDEHVRRGYSLGAVDYIIKPFAADELRGKVRAYAEMYREKIAIKSEMLQLVPGTGEAPILIVDDTQANLLALTEALKPLGERLLTAASGPEALSVLMKEDVAILVTDIQMPGMDGFELVQKLRENERFRNLNVVFVTAIYRAPQDVKRGYALGAVDYIVLPCPPEIFQAKIRACLNIYRNNLSLAEHLERIKRLNEELAAKGEELKNLNATLEKQLLERTETLRKSEEKFKTIFDRASDGILIVDAITKEFLQGNTAICSMLGYTKEEIESLTVNDIHPPQDLSHVLGEFEKQAAEGEAALVEGLPVLRKDGSIFYADISSSSAIIGGVPCLLGIFRDITERKQAEEAIVTAKKDWENTFGAVTDMITIHDADFNIVRANPAAKAILGLQLQAGMPLEKCFRFYHGTENPPPECPTCQSLQTGRPSSTEMFEPHLKKHLEIRAMPRFGSDGRLVGLIHIVRDITERKRAEEALRESEERYRVIAEAASDVILVIGEGSRITFANPASENVFGYVCDEIIGQSITLLMPEDLRPIHLEAFKRYLNTGQRGLDWKAVELRGRHKSGREFPIEVSFGEFVRDGKHIFAGIVRDITERKQREREVGAIATVSASLRTAPTRAEMLPVILDQLLNLLKVDGALLAMHDATTGETNIELGRGPAGQNFTGLRLPPGEGIAGQVIATGQPYVNSDVQSDPRFVRPDLLPADTRAMACAPLTVQGQTIGALCLLHAWGIAAHEIRLLTAIADIAANAIHRATLYEQTERRLQRLTALRAVDMAISSSLDLRVTLNILLDQTTTHLRVDAADILMFNRYTQTLDYAAGRGFRSPAITRSHLRLGEGQAGSAALERRTIHIPNLAEETTFVRAGLLANENFIAHYATPLIAKGEVKGLLEIFHRAPLTSDPEWLDFLEALAGQAAIAIDNAELFDGLQRSNTELAMAYDATIEGWSRAMDLRDKETEGHTQRVTELTVQLARAAGMSDEQIAHVRRGALLHDMGKLGVPDSILLKPGKLTDEEWVTMRQHPQFAFDMLSRIDYLRPALDIPYCHHEKWDGAGYPRGLKGEQIPLAARLFAVVDVWDALRSDRPYRQGWSGEKVIEHIKAGSGAHFDPKAVELFLRVVSEKTNEY